MISCWRLSWKVFFVLPVFLFASCGKHEEAGQPFIAKVGASRIAPADLQRELKRIGPEITAQQREAALQNLIRTEALYQRAEQVGFDKDPDTQARVKRLIASAYEEKLRGPEASHTNAPAELEEYYAMHSGDFLTPERVKIATIVLRVPHKATEEKRREVQANAAAILSEAKQLPANVTNFGDLARQYSEEQSTRYVGGEMNWMTQRELEARWDPQIADAIFQMKTNGELKGPILAPEGVVLFKMIGREQAKAKPLSEVRDLAAYRVRQQKEAAEQKAFEEKLRAGLNIEINRDLLNAIKVTSTNEPATPPALPGK